MILKFRVRGKRSESEVFSLTDRELAIHLATSVADHGAITKVLADFFVVTPNGINILRRARLEYDALDGLLLEVAVGGMVEISGRPEEQLSAMLNGLP